MTEDEKTPQPDYQDREEILRVNEQRYENLRAVRESLDAQIKIDSGKASSAPERKAKVA